MRKNIKGQVWLETVVYILIGLVLIGLVLTFVTPRINEKKDRIIIEQTITALNSIDQKINEVLESGQYNKRVVEFQMSKGELTFDSQNNKIVFVLDELTRPYSEPGISIPLGRVVLQTTQDRKYSAVSITLQYNSGIDLTFNDQDVSEKITPSSQPYKFYIENKGIVNVGIEKAFKVDITK